MNNVPTIGGAKGIFEFFVPGIFMLTHLGAFLYFIPLIDIETKRQVVDIASGNIISFIITLSFGYLAGITLRLLSPNIPDYLSAKVCQVIYKEKNKEIRKSFTDEFPYLSWIEEETCKLKIFPPSDDIISFFNSVWKNRPKEYHEREFINYLRTMISCNDEKSAAEIYAAEALVRYISDMFYALLISFFLGVIFLFHCDKITLTVMLILIWMYVIAFALKKYAPAFLLDWYISAIIYGLLGIIGLGFIFLVCSVFKGSVSGDITATLLVLVIYAFALIVILLHFRHIRIKEVETLFFASYKNKSLFQ